MEGLYTATTMRRPKWQYPSAQQTPRILHLPRRPRRKPHKPSPAKPTSQKEKTGKLEALFDQERSFAREAVPVVLVSPGESEERRRERVEERKSGVIVAEEEKWRFQAEMLRAECNLLRMEREIAFKKLERRRVQMERILKSAVQTLLSGSKKIWEGQNVSFIFEEEINNLVKKLEKLQKRSGVKDLEVRNCSNFDKKAFSLQRRLGKFGGMSDEEICVKEIQEMAEATLSIKTDSQFDDSFVSSRNSNVEILRRKMEGLSKGVLLERVEEEYSSMLSTVSCSATSSRRMEFPDMSMLSVQPSKEAMFNKGKVCTGHCKAIVERIVEQVRAETEQWSQMQEMLGLVRDEMEELQASRDFWEDRALDSDNQIQSLRSAVKEWRQKALSSETKANELQAQLSMYRIDIESLKKGKERAEERARNLPPLPRDQPQDETEKRVLVCHVKENHQQHVKDGCSNQEAFSDAGRRKAQTCNIKLLAPRRSPLRDVGNMSPLMRQPGKEKLANCPVHCHYKEDMRRAF